MIEAIRAAAVRNPYTGEVYESDNHASCYCEAGFGCSERDGWDPAEWDLWSANEGFTTTTGRFVGRQEALHIARRAAQVQYPRRRREWASYYEQQTSLLAEDVDFPPLEPPTC